MSLERRWTMFSEYKNLYANTDFTLPHGLVNSNINQIQAFCFHSQPTMATLSMTLNIVLLDQNFQRFFIFKLWHVRKIEAEFSFFFLTVKQYQNELSFQKQPPEVFCRWHLSVTFSHLFKHILRGYYINRAVSIILVKKEALAKVFSCGSWEIFNNTFFHASCFFLFFINTYDFFDFYNH